MDSSKKEEFDRLYQLLSSLSTKSKTDEVLEPGNHIVPEKQKVPMISLQNCTTASRLPPEFLPKPYAVPAIPLPATPFPFSTQETSEVLDMPLQTTPLPLTLFNPEFTIVSTYQELHEKKKKITYQCESCLKSFAAKDTYDTHTSQSIACQQWKALSKEEKQHPIDRPINELVHDLLQQAIGTSDPFQCRYCNMTFVSRGNHNKHLQVAVACNRLAYLAFMRTITNLNTPHKD